MPYVTEAFLMIASYCVVGPEDVEATESLALGVADVVVRVVVGVAAEALDWTDAGV